MVECPKCENVMQSRICKFCGFSFDEKNQTTTQISQEIKITESKNYKSTLTKATFQLWEFMKTKPSDEDLLVRIQILNRDFKNAGWELVERQIRKRMLTKNSATK